MEWWYCQIFIRSLRDWNIICSNPLSGSDFELPIFSSKPQRSQYRAKLRIWHENTSYFRPRSSKQKKPKIKAQKPKARRPLLYKKHSYLSPLFTQKSGIFFFILSFYFAWTRLKIFIWYFAWQWWLGCWFHVWVQCQRVSVLCRWSLTNVWLPCTRFNKCICPECCSPFSMDIDTLHQTVKFDSYIH